MLTFISAPSKELRSPMILILAKPITEPKTSKKTRLQAGMWLARRGLADTEARKQRPVRRFEECFHMRLP